MALQTTTIGTKIYAKCQLCNKFRIANSQAGHSIEGGIRIKFIGGYADYYDPFHEEETVSLDICHECTNKVLKLLNLYDHENFRGGHPSERDEDPCCDNCWIPVYENNKWVGTKDPRTNEIKYHK
jgi:hypothetical protein